MPNESNSQDLTPQAPAAGYGTRDYVLDRLFNPNAIGEGSLLPPRQVGPWRVPFADGFRVVRTAVSSFGGTDFTLTWGFSEALASYVDHFEIYVRGLGSTGGQRIGPFRADRSPCVVRLESAAATRVTFFIQTVLKSGLQSDIDTSPSCTGVTIAAGGSSSYPAGTIPVSAFAAGTAGQLITWDAAGLPTTVPTGSSGQVLKSQGAGTTPIFVTNGGDVSGAPEALTLASIVGAAGPIGSATVVPIVTIDVKGRVTALSSTTITGTAPGGSAGGALTGTYPNPGIANLGTAGAIAFVHGTNTDRLTIDDANLHWDDTNNRLGIGTNSPAYPLDVRGNISVGTAGAGFRVAEGSNAKMGKSTLVGGTVTVATTAVTANSRIFLTHQNNSGTPGFVTVSARNAATDFTITSSSATDTSDIAWILFEPA